MASPSYNRASPGKLASCGSRHLMPAHREKILGPFCQRDNRICEWLQSSGGQVRCGWYGDELASHESGAASKCQECREEPGKVPSKVDCVT